MLHLTIPQPRNLCIRVHTSSPELGQRRRSMAALNCQCSPANGGTSRKRAYILLKPILVDPAPSSLFLQHFHRLVVFDLPTSSVKPPNKYRYDDAK
ncbi:hypothetical protein Hanom_Chr14g01262571 [Helianthus anomalus]